MLIGNMRYSSHKIEDMANKLYLLKILKVKKKTQKLYDIDSGALKVTLNILCFFYYYDS